MSEGSSVYHKYRSDGIFTERILSDRKVFLATAHQLNDPFECSISDISREWILGKVEEARAAGLTGFLMEARRAIKDGSHFFGATREDIHAILDIIKAAPDLDAKFQAYRAFMVVRRGHPPSDMGQLFSRLDDQLTAIGIFSLSRNPAQPLMWAHYGDQHRGVCFGFREAPGSKLADPAHLLPVVYADELPRMNEDGLRVESSFSVDDDGRLYSSSLKLAFNDETLRRVVSTKSTCWAYEEEVRYIEPYGGLCDWPGELAECTFGLRCSDDRRRHYVELLELNVPTPVALFEIRAVAGTNALERVPMDPPHTRSRMPAEPRRSDGEPRELARAQFTALMEQLVQQEQYGEVIFQTGVNLERNPDDPVLLHIKAVAHGHSQQHEEAYRIFKRLGALFPDTSGPLYGQACAAEALGRLDEVIPLLRRAAQLDPADTSIALNLGINLARSPETRSEGLEHLRRAERLGHRRAGRIIREFERPENDGIAVS